MSTRRGNGEGSLTYRADRDQWEGRVFVEKDGKRKRVSVYHKKKGEAARLMKALKDKQPLKGGEIFLDDYFDHYLAQINGQVRQITWAGYEGYIRLHLKPLLGGIRLDDLTAAHVRDWVKNRQASGLSRRSVEYAMTVLRQTLKMAMAEDRVDRNVASLVSVPAPRAHKAVVLSQKDATRLLMACQGERLGALYRVALSYGLRLGEVTALRWEDIDFGAGVIRVRRSLIRVPTAFRTHGEINAFSDLKTDESQRDLPLIGPVREALLEHRQRQEAEKAAALYWNEEWDGLVFCTEIGGPLDRSLVRKHFGRVVEKAGLPHMRFHDLRHSAASILFAEGADILTVKGILGHRKVQTTQNLYTHLIPGVKEEALEKMASKLASIGAD